MGDFLAEWGLSFLIDTGEESILFDTGKSVSASYNFASMKIDPHRISKIVLSHGHHDHTGGLREVLRLIGHEVEVIAHPDIWAPKYSRRKGESVRHIGVPFARRELEHLGARFNLTTKPVKLNENMMTTGEVPMLTAYETIEPVLFVKNGENWQPDQLLDDQALVIKDEEGLAIVLGCAHRGMMNTIYYAQKLTGVEKVHTVIGGSHLINASEEQLEMTVIALRQLHLKRLALCHCTGFFALSRLFTEFGDKFILTNAGTIIEL